MSTFKFIEKPWGYEKIIEKNDKYVMKELFMKEGNQCSLQYHEKKHETVYVISGKLKLTIEGKESVLHPGFTISIPPNTVHRMKAITDTLYLEASTPELDDVVRLKDDYNRG